MAWEWSHTAEAYANLRDNIYDLDRPFLEDAYSEWFAYDIDKGEDPDHFSDGMRAAEKVSSEFMLAQQIWDRTEKLRTCDNGGFRAWVCPFGCHTVSFDREEQ